MNNNSTIVNGKYPWTIRQSLGRFALCSSLLALPILLIGSPSHALTLSAASLSNSLINAETLGPQTSTTVQFTLDGPADVTVSIFRVANGTDNPGTLVTTLQANGLAAGANTILWNGLWLIAGDNGRSDGSYRFRIDASSSSTVAPSVTLPTLLQITSV